MKKIITITFAMLSLTAQAKILESKYDSNHQVAIEKKINSECGSFRNLTQVSSKEEVIVIDQGIRDIKFTTTLSGLQRLDQNIFDEYEITVESEYSDMYDHENQTWGVYTVNSVNCQMK